MTAKIMNELKNTEALLILSEPNRFYITKFSSSAGYVLVTAEKSYFLIDFRYYEKAKQTVSGCEVILSSSPLSEIKELCEKNGITTLYIECDSVTVGKYKLLEKELSPVSVSEDSKFDRMLRDMRSVKSESELALIRQAQELTDKTFAYITDRITAGRTEREIMLDMEFYMRKLGSEGVSFDFIVVSGKNSSLPHGVPTDKKIENGDFVTMDFGAVVGGYRSDMTRTVAVGGVSEEQKLVYNTVLKAQLAAIEKIKSGAVCSEIDKIARDIIYGAGYKNCFGHALGHSVGIEIHENPSFSPRCNTVLKSGTVMTVEPGIYIENKFGVRIEDMVFVTDGGCTDITKSPKELIIL